MRGSRCDACGAARETRPRDAPADDAFRPYALDPDVDTSGLEQAIDAFHAKDLPSFVEQLVAAEGGATARSAPSPDGPGWIAVVRSALLFVALRGAADELVVEAPIARLAARRRLPALRLALELSAGDTAGSRVSLRGDLLLIRFTARLSLLTPPALRHHLREIGHLASRYAGLMVIGEGALPATFDDQRSALAFDALGRAKKIHIGTASGLRRSIPPPQMPPPHERSQPGDPRPRRPDSVIPARPLKREEDPPIPPAADSSESMPAVLAPRFASPTPQPQPAAALRAPPPGQDPPLRRAPSVVGMSAVATAPISSSDAAVSPADRLCMLLRQAQSLASLTLEERPASMPWLVRSTVFRCVYDYKETLPDAVAHLFRTASALMNPGSSRASQSLAAPSEPALLIMERVIVARGQMPREKPLAVEPMTSAAQAKEHVARYLLEIDRAPADPSLRHFLALGALSELLARTKLPPQTDQRLRDIVAHAQREGAKGPAIDLMMTALQRITA
jgi:hypothetical protein